MDGATWVFLMRRKPGIAWNTRPTASKEQCFGFKGVKEAKPEHWAQMQCYMNWAGLERALYIAVWGSGR